MRPIDKNTTRQRTGFPRRAIRRPPTERRNGIQHPRRSEVAHEERTYGCFPSRSFGLVRFPGTDQRERCLPSDSAAIEDAFQCFARLVLSVPYDATGLALN